APDSRFFFQAEDGIRDYKVTGVQTCALPISPRLGSRPGMYCCANSTLKESSAPIATTRPGRTRARVSETPSGMKRMRFWINSARSEERRVGKEWRGGWTADRKRK